MRLLTLLLMLAACRRDFQKLEPPPAVEAEPEFLDEASGIYRAFQLGNGKAEEDPDPIEVLVVGSGIAFGSDSGENDASLDIVGELTRDPMTGVRTASIDLPAPQGARREATIDHIRFGLTLGFDTILGRVDLFLSDGTTVPEASNLVMQKVCDYDARLAGIYDAAIVKTAESGNCTGLSALEGDRRWALAVGNGRTGAAIVSLRDRTPDIAARLHFDGAALTFGYRRAFSQFAETWGEGSDFSARIVRDDETTRLLATMTRKTPNGCTQSYSAEAVRLTGTQPGISCPLEPLAPQCPVLTQSCPLLDSGLGELVKYEVALSARSDDGKCPQVRCSGVMRGSALCTGESETLAVLGCLPGMALSVVPTGGCVELSCAPSGVTCSSRSPDEVLAEGDGCDRESSVSFQQGSDGCLSVACVGPDSDCPRPPPCGDFLVTSTWRHSPLEIDACQERWCALGYDRVHTDQGELETLFGDAYYGARTVLKGGYRVVAATDGLQVETANDCPGLDLQALTVTCPDSGVPSACLREGSPGLQSFHNQLVLHRRGSALCLGIIDPISGRRLSGFESESCPAGTNRCCDNVSTAMADARLLCYPGAYHVKGMLESGGGSYDLQLYRNGSMVELLPYAFMGSTSFEFLTDLLSDDTFAVGVSGAICAVTGGTGIVQGEDYNDVFVACP